jgi:hypothetical protein
VVSDAQKLTARDAEVLWAIRTFFEVNKYKTALNFDEVLEACPENIVAGILRPILEHLEASRFLRRDPHGLISLTPLGLGVTDKHASFDRGTFTAFCDLLLVALANHSEQQVTKFDAFDLRAIAELYALEFTPGWIAGASEVFEKRELAKIKRFSESEQDSLISAALTGPGLWEADRLRKELLERGIIPPTYPPLDSLENIKTSAAPSAGTAPTFISSDLDAGSSGKADSIPAADRFVTRADNAPLFEDANKKLQAVIDAIPADNELRVSAEDRLLLIREVKDVQSLIKQPRVQLRAIYHATRESSILVSLAKELGTGAVHALAAAAVTALLALLFL